MMARRRVRALALLFPLSLLGCTPAALEAAANGAAAPSDEIRLDPAYDAYSEVEGLSGELTAIGSDTMLNVMTLWSRNFHSLHPGVVVNVEGQGSGTAPSALTEGLAQLGPMSRPMNDDELAAFVQSHGYPPTAIPVAIDGLAIYVHKDNPIDRLTLAQVDALFSATRNCGHPEAITTWGQLVQVDDWAEAPIELYGRDPRSGTYGFFKQHALCEGEFGGDVLEQPGSAAVVHKVARSRYAVGYSGIAYRTPGVKALALARRKGEPAYTWKTAGFYSSNYPLSRHLYVYVDKPPGTSLDPLLLEFLRFGLSLEGQQLVLKDGFVPLPADVAARELAKLE